MIPVLAVLSCHQVVEFSSSETCALTFLSADELEVTGSMEGFHGGRLLLSDGSGGLLLVTSDGFLHRLNAADLTVDTCYAIGGSSGSGYTDGVRAGNGSLYVLGPGSLVIEVDLVSDNVVDGFVPGPDPVAIAASPVMPRLYFADGTGFIGEIWTGDNHTGNTVGLAQVPADIMVEPLGGMHVVAAASDQQGTIYDLWLEYSQQYARTMSVQAQSPASCIVPFGLDSCFAVGCPEWSGENGYVCFVRGYVDSVDITRVEVEGHPVDLCFNGAAGGVGRLYVMSRTEGGTTAITVFGFTFSYLEPELVGTVFLDGFPRDLASPGDGDELIVLTSDK
ncbi:MAG: hypothetical protein AVO35_05940 [Candidatus Aegiribacteria sp. MLS_C]|nr:MAG: hypothetical protein AVO35_05940 [Candidatus Aegiribacteria sp. MLS_C]